mmetsp:Transcript_26861/g.62648  ORF Transcript_26861/g.62648 Transcript_26861/m.62648 type:complete len:204 (-) Transcript_26861:7-618(-)
MKDILLCSGCKAARYCSRACQKKHWKAHKQQCKLFQQTADNELEVAHAAIDKLLGSLFPKWPRPSFPLLRVVLYLAEKYACGMLKEEQKVCVNIVFESAKDALLWVKDPFVRTHFQVCTLENMMKDPGASNRVVQLLSEARHPLDLVLSATVAVHDDSGAKFFVGRAVRVPHVCWLPGDKVEVRCFEEPRHPRNCCSESGTVT